MTAATRQWRDEAPPCVDEKLYAPFKIAAAVRAVSKLGVPADAVLDQTGLRPQQLTDPHTRTSIRQFIQVCANAKRLCREPGLAFLIGRRLNVTSYGLYGHALQSCTSMRETYQTAVRFHRLATPVIPIDWVVGADTVSWVLSDRPPPFIPVDPALYRFLLDMQLAIVCTLHREIGGPACLPEKAVIAGAPPEHADLYRHHLQCPVTFGGPHHELHYASALLDRPCRLSNPLAAASATDMCTKLLKESFRSTGMAGQISQALQREPGVFPSVETVAHSLHVTSRTLHRRLKAEGTSFRQLVTDVRQSMAKQYLRNTALSLEEIAFALGFSDAAGFRHAFKRWTQQSPTVFRRN